MLVTVFERANRPRGRHYDTPLGDLIGRIRSGAYAEEIAAVRAEADDAKRKALKLESLPVFTPSGRFTSRTANGLAEHAGTMIYDFDHAPDVDALRASVLACPHLVACFVSPSGDGCKAILRVVVADTVTGEMRPPRDVAEHKAAWEAGARLLDTGDAAGLIDASGKDVARACFLSHDPEAYFNDDADTLVVDLSPPTSPPPRSSTAAPDRERERMESALAHVGRHRLPYPEWIKLIAAVLDAVGGDERDAEALLIRYVGEEVPGEYADKLAHPTDREVTAASLYYLAQAAGWTDPFRRTDARAGSRPAGRHRPRFESAPEAGDVQPLGVCLADVTAEAIRWAWPGWLASGKLHVFDGNPGAGKSTFVAALAASVTSGVQWPDGAPVPPSARGAVVYLTTEDDAATTIRPRMEAAGANLSRVRVIATVPTVDRNPYGRVPTLPNDVGLLISECERIGARLLVVDPVMAYLGDVNSHRDSDVRGALAPLAAAAEEAGVAVVLIRHLNKGTGASALYRGGGSIAFAGLARVVWVAGSDPAQPDARALAVGKNNLSRFPPALGYELESAGRFGVGRVRWTGEVQLSADDLVRPHGPPPAASPARDAAEEWLEAALAGGERLARELLPEAEAAGISERTLKRAKHRLGVVVEKRGGMNGAWYWTLDAPKRAKAPRVGPLPERMESAGDGIAPDSTDFPKGATPLAPLPPVALFEGGQASPADDLADWPARPDR